MEKENTFFLEEKKNRKRKGGKYLEKISPKIVKDIEKTRFQKVWSQKKSIGLCFGKFGIRKKVSNSENLVSEKKSRYRFRSKFWYRHSVLNGCIAA